MRTSAPGRWLLAAPFAGVLFLLTVAPDVPRAAAGEDVRACLMGEADRFFSRLATAIGSFELEPARVDDAYITRESEPIIEKCANGGGQSAEVEVAAFRAHMARWSYHLDRKLSEITARGSPD